MGKYFGTDGFRGEANINLTVEHAYKVGRYIGWYFNQKSSSRAKIGDRCQLVGDDLFVTNVKFLEKGIKFLAH